MYLNRICSFILSFFLLVGSASFAAGQVGDDYADAIEIAVPDQGFGEGALVSPSISLVNKTTEVNEYFHDDLIRAALVEKSVWFKFRIPTNRSVSVQLESSGNLSQQDAGMVIYYNPGNFAGPHRVSKQLPPLNRMGSVSNTCLAAGEYYIQVLSRKRAVDSVNLSLTVAKYTSYWSELVNTPLLNYFGNILVSPIAKCSYIPDLNVASMMPDSSYHHFMNWRFEAFAKSSKTQHDVILYGRPIPSFYYVVKEGYPKPINQWQILDSGKFNGTQKSFLWDCTLGNSLAEGTYRLLLFSQAPGIYKAQISHNLKNQGSSLESNPKKLPAAQRLGVLNGSSNVLEGTLSCNTPVYLNECPNLNTQLSMLNYQGDSVALEFQTWYTFSVSYDCRLAINSLKIPWQPDINGRIAVRLYKGDNLNNCSIAELEPDYGRVYCLKAGQAYTVRLLAPYDQNVLDQTFRLSLDFIPYKNHPHKFSDSLYPEVIQDAFANFPSTTEGEEDFLKYTGKKIQIGSDALFVAAKFHEFYIPADLVPFNLSISGYTHFATPDRICYLVRGRKSNGSSADVVASFAVSQDFPSGLAPGWYTLVHTTKPIAGSCHDVSADKPFALNFKPLEECNPGALEAKLNNPIRLNGSSPLRFNQVAVNGNIQFSPNEYTTPNFCFNSSLIDTGYGTWLNSFCQLNTLDKAFNYVEFELLEEAETYINISGYRFWLIRGSASQNPSIRFSSSNYITPCKYEGKFCRLAASKYTIVILGRIGDYAPFALSIGPVGVKANDFIENSIAIGMVTDTFRTTPLLINCSFGTDESDIIVGLLTPAHNSANQLDTGTNAPISNSRFMSAWYDLSLEGLGMLQLKSSYGIHVYEILDTVKWKQWRGKAQFRDSLASCLKLYIARAEHDAKGLKVINGLCTRRHFAILLKRNSTYRPYVSDLNGTWFGVSKSTPEPDFCQTAGEISIQSYTNETHFFDSRCLSRGEGFGEDGKNMACLPLDIEYATMWVKVHIDPGDVYDVRFGVNANFGGYANNEIHYRILYGSCSALNPGPCVVDANTQIGFQCMEPGDYFLQIAVPKDMGSAYSLKDLIGVQVFVSSNQKALSCFPFQLTKPLASFIFDGQCDTDSVTFTNYSSQGTDISYLWDFGNGLTSTDKDPKVNLTTNQVSEDREILLYVTNIQNGLSDSFSRHIRLWKDRLSVQVPFTDTLIRCGTQLKIASSHTFPDGISLYCLDNKDTLDGNEINKRFTQNSSIRFLVWTAGCFAETLVSVKVDYKLGEMPRDTLLCRGGSLVLDLSNRNSVSVGPFVKGPIYELKDAGTYVFVVSDSGCVYTDSIDIISKAQVWPYASDTSVCDADSIVLQVDGQYQNIRWQDSSSNFQFTARQSGLYWVEGQWDECFNRDSILVMLTDLSNPLLLGADTQCTNYEWTLRSNKAAQSYLWSNGENTNEIRTSDTGWTYLIIQSGACYVKDSIWLYSHEPDLDLGNDTVYCDHIDWVLDAGEGTAYAWWPLFSDQRHFIVPDSGIWGVWKIDKYGCEQEDTIYIKEECGPYFQMPNAFSPNGDGTNDFLQWVAVDIQEFEIYIYNRWGELMHHTTDINAYWNGNFRGITAGDGVYVYIIKYAGTSSNGIREEGKESGTFILLRSDR